MSTLQEQRILAGVEGRLEGRLMASAELSQAEIASKAVTDDAGMARIFDSLKPKQGVWVRISAVMGGGGNEYRYYTVGRRGNNKRFGYKTLTLLVNGKAGHATANRRQLMKNANGSMSAAIGDMGASLKGIYVP